MCPAVHQIDGRRLFGEGAAKRVPQLFRSLSERYHMVKQLEKQLSRVSFRNINGV